MKLEKIFDAKDGKLIKIDGADFHIKALPLSWREVEPDEEGAYNEEKLAALRLELKALEGTSQFVYISPVADKNAAAEQLTAAMKHAARRLKDCTAIAGFAIPDTFSAENAAHFVEELSQKHAQYVFFSKVKIEGLQTILL